MDNYNKLFSAKKIALFGWPASGKSTLSNVLSKKMNIDAYSLDIIRWKYINDGVKDDSKFLEEYNKILELDSWIIEGNALDFIDSRLEKADVLIFFDSTIEQSINNFLLRDNKIKNGEEERINFDNSKSCDDTIEWIRERYSKKILKLRPRLSNYENKLIVINNYDELDKILFALSE